MRCSRCILPSTFPGIHFDADGVCNICNEHTPGKLGNIEDLKRMVEDFKDSDGTSTCVIGISGGRDSCFGLHVAKKELGLNPISFTYDWGLVTDTARQNVAKLVGKLGVEHVTVSPDIAKKGAMLGSIFKPGLPNQAWR